MIVMKFGGTSVQDAAAIHNVAEIVKSKLARQPIVVVSAMARVTDALLRIARTAEARHYDKAKAIIAELKARHLKTAHELLAADDAKLREGYKLKDVEHQIDHYFAELDNFARSIATLGELTLRTKDALASFGERLSSLIIASAFQVHGIDSELVDSRRFVITDDKFTSAAPQQQPTEAYTR